jgi:hypothetical protein
VSGGHLVLVILRASARAAGFSSLYPKYKGVRPPEFSLAQRRKVKKIAGPARRSMTCRLEPAAFRLPPSSFHLPPGAGRSWRSSWSLRGVVDDISHEGLRALLREEGVPNANHQNQVTAAHLDDR